MKKIVAISTLFLASLGFGDTVINPKKCETIGISKYTKLISCYKVDYLVEYKIDVDTSEVDSVKKITMITPQGQKVIRDER